MMMLPMIGVQALADPTAKPSPSKEELLRAAVDELVAANHVLDNEGILAGGYGHVSMRSPVNPERILISRALAPRDVTKSDIVELDLDCNPVPKSDVLQYQERFIHCAIYKARPDVNAVVHSHTSATVAFSITNVPLKPVISAAIIPGQGVIPDEGVPVLDATTLPGPSADNMIARPDLGKAVADYLGKANSLLLRNHGNVVVGESLSILVFYSIALDNNAKILLQAKTLGGEIHYLNRSSFTNQQLKGLISGEARGWTYLKKKAEDARAGCHQGEG
jgi:ribulose-5-phosphate 4-epimerase/fuculose-1-phosphate aldolase